MSGGRRHLHPVPDVHAADPSSLPEGSLVLELLERAGLHPAGPIVYGGRVHGLADARVIIGEPPAEPPGWWVCPDCGRRRDRAGEPRTVTSVLCTGPASPYTRRHAPTEMRVRR